MAFCYPVRIAEGRDDEHFMPHFHGQTVCARLLAYTRVINALTDISGRYIMPLARLEISRMNQLGNGAA